MSANLSPEIRARLARLAEAPEPADWQAATRSFLRMVADHYGSAVEDCFLFGSRARGDARPSSDVDVAVVFRDAEEPDWRRLRDLSGFAFDVLVETGVQIQPHPVSSSAWRNPSGFLASARRDARRLQ